ncbi:MAG: hypothetical protein MJY56_05160, partial [Bacteroidales bacterium]|nr:hypothetical protein [Bacteroidales bacterium]
LEFKAMQEQMVNTFNQYYVSGETFADGKKTLDENMADLGALEISWYACEKRLKGLYSGEALKDHERRFFRSYAWFWAKYMTDAEKEKMVRGDEHSIYDLRVNGIVNNIDSWYDLFDVKRGDKLYLSPSRRVEFW